MGTPYCVGAAALVISATVLSGCSTQVALSVLGGGTSALVTHNLNGSVNRTFTSSLPEVREAAVTALETMVVATATDAAAAPEETIVVTAGDRAIEIGFEPLGDKLTVLRVVARRPGFLRDNATAGEVVRQTELALASIRGDAATMTAGRPTRSAVSPAVPAESVYVLRLDTIPPDGWQTMKPLPSSLQNHVLYTTELQRGGRRQMTVNLGYFASEEEAIAARRLAVAVFPRATVVRFMQEVPSEDDARPEERLHKANRFPVLQRAAYF